MHLVLGLGKSGQATIEYLLARGEKILGVDQKVEQLRAEAACKILEARGVTLCREDADLPWQSFKALITSPGISQSHPLLIEARKRQLPVTSETEIGAQHLSRAGHILIGITGSNGKTTTTLLVEHILQCAGKRARAVGNVGLPLISQIDAAPQEPTLFVVELSSFQLSYMETRCFDLGLILNISANHLDWHTDFEEYAAAKWRLSTLLKENAPLYIGEKAYSHYSNKRDSRALLLSQERNFLSLREKIDSFCSLRYRDNRWEAVAEETLQAAYVISSYLGVQECKFWESCHSFQKPPHRLERVRCVKGVDYINDSKATTIDAVKHALSLTPGPIWLIAGGVHKGGEFAEWLPLCREKVKGVLAIGKAAAKIHDDLHDFGRTEIFSTLSEALLFASASAVQGDKVLLSPGCASYDQFRSFEERGQIFKEQVWELRE